MLYLSFLACLEVSEKFMVVMVGWSGVVGWGGGGLNQFLDEL